MAWAKLSDLQLWQKLPSGRRVNRSKACRCMKYLGVGEEWSIII